MKVYTPGRAASPRQMPSNGIEQRHRNAEVRRGNAFLADQSAEYAAGTIAAQVVIDEIRHGKHPAVAFDALLALVDRSGINSAAVAAFTAELGRRAAR